MLFNAGQLRGKLFIEDKLFISCAEPWEAGLLIRGEVWRIRESEDNGTNDDGWWTDTGLLSRPRLLCSGSAGPTIAIFSDF